MTPTAILLAVVATVLLFLTAGFAAEGKRVLQVLRTGVSQRVQIQAASAQVLFGLVLFGVVVGIPVSLGLVGTPVLSLLAAPLCCMVGSWLLSGDFRQAPAAIAWYAVMGWCALVPYLMVGSFSATATSAHQAVLGPLALHQGPARTICLIAAVSVGCLASSRWVSTLPSQWLPGLGTLLRWAEWALAGALVSGAVFGPGLGAAAYGPLDAADLRWTASSMASTVLAVMLVVFLSKRPTHWVSDRYLFPVLATIASAAMVGAVVG